MHFHMGTEREAVNPQVYDREHFSLSTLRRPSFSSPVQPRYQSRAKGGKVHRYALNAHPKVCKGLCKLPQKLWKGCSTVVIIGLRYWQQYKHVLMGKVNSVAAGSCLQPLCLSWLNKLVDVRKQGPWAVAELFLKVFCSKGNELKGKNRKRKGVILINKGKNNFK